MEHDVNHEIIQTSTRTEQGSTHFDTQDNGLAKGHAYTVIGVTTEVPGKRLVKIRNPWGTERYKGPWCDGCKEWNDVSQEVKTKLGYQNADDGIFYMTVEDYWAGFEETNVNFDLADGDWHEDHYLFVNDEDRKNASSGSCYDCTRHEFKLTNSSTEAQKAYIQFHVWHDRTYSKSDPDCKFWSNYYKLNLPGTESEGPSNFRNTKQVIHEM